MSQKNLTELGEIKRLFFWSGQLRFFGHWKSFKNISKNIQEALKNILKSVHCYKMPLKNILKKSMFLKNLYNWPCKIYKTKSTFSGSPKNMFFFFFWYPYLSLIQNKIKKHFLKSIFKILIFHFLVREIDILR